MSGWTGLALPTVLTGFGHGSLFGMSGVLVIGRFGMQSFSFNNSMLALAPAIFGQSLLPTPRHSLRRPADCLPSPGQAANLLFGRIYDSHVFADPTVLTAAKTCTLGRECYVQAFQVTTVMSALAVATGLVLCRRRSMHR